ncbi:hypothetical protein EYF80_002015 [Liparis tanakae]|uniref:Uncharacterized protein n=1 Tax=Liparis tanakae TaxID=230148 RepID=A0A4Z2JDD9_9TELE|nr:hypothetical protein EYF80_002015 [Liparis tanakae]
MGKEKMLKSTLPVSEQTSGDAEVPDARGRELAGVQVGDVLHDLVKGINVVALHAEATSSGSCTSSPSLQVYKQSITFLFSSFPERIISPARASSSKPCKQSVALNAADLVQFPVELGWFVVLCLRWVLAQEEDQPAVVDVQRVVVPVHLCSGKYEREDQYIKW